MIYFQALLTTILPFFLMILIFFFWLFYAIIKRKDISAYREKLLSTFIITIFSLQPIIINYLFNIVSCQWLDKPYIQSALTVECFTDDHYSWILNLFIPSFCFYGLLLPFVAFSYMKIYSCDLNLLVHVRIVGFLSNGYRRKKFYWEFLFFYRKIVIIFIAQFFLWSVEAKTILVLLILFVSLWQQARDNPFITEDLNSLDFKATMFSFCTLFSGLFSYDFIQTPEVAFVFMLFVFFLNIFFIIIWIRRMLVLNKDLFYKPFARRFFFWILPYIEKLQSDFDTIEQEAFISLSYFNKRKTNPKEEKPPKPSVFHTFRTGLSRITSPEYGKKGMSTNKSFTGRLDILKTQMTPDRDMVEMVPANISKTDVNNETQRKKVTFAHKKESPNVSRSYLNNNSVSELLERKSERLEESHLIRDLLALKDEHIASLYAEIHELKREVQSQKKELAHLREQLQRTPHKIKDIKDSTTKKAADFKQEKRESGYFLEILEVSENKFFNALTNGTTMEIVTPFFILLIERKSGSYRTSMGLACELAFGYKNFQNNAVVQSVILKTTKNLLTSKRQFDGFSTEKTLDFLLEKVLRLGTQPPALLTIETVVSTMNKLHKIEIKLPIRDWVFFIGPHQGFEVFSEDNMRLLFDKRLISREINKKLLNSIGFKDCAERKSMISVLKANIEGSQTFTLAIEEREGKFGVWVLNGERMQTEAEEFVKEWVEQEFFKGFVERKATEG